MTTPEPVESQIAEWRSFVEQSAAVDGRDVDELESHLREQIGELESTGLAGDEAFLIAVKRLGSLDQLSREFAREHSGRLWRQLVLSGDERQPEDGHWAEALAFAALAAVALQVARLVAGFPQRESLWLVRNAGFFVLPFLAAYFARQRGLAARRLLIAAAPFALAAVVVNLFPYRDGSSSELLVAAHLPVVLWIAVGYAYTGGALRSHERRMDFVRFTGEWFIYYVLIALGGAVLLALTALVLEPTGLVDAERLFEWVLPSGAAGAVIVAAWLVESKQRVVENMAPVLTTVFTPLFAVMLAVAAASYALTGPGSAFDRELLGIFDALLVVVVGLVLYRASARDPMQAPGWMERIQLVAVGSALALDLMVLGAMAARIGDLGLTPNRAAALGLNLVLLGNLGGGAWLSLQNLRGRGTLLRLERWQTGYLPVFAVWAATVVVLLPPAFAFA